MLTNKASRLSRVMSRKLVRVPFAMALGLCGVIGRPFPAAISATRIVRRKPPL